MNKQLIVNYGGYQIQCLRFVKRVPLTFDYEVNYIDNLIVFCSGFKFIVYLFTNWLRNEDVDYISRSFTLYHLLFCLTLPRPLLLFQLRNVGPRC